MSARRKAGGTKGATRHAVRRVGKPVESPDDRVRSRWAKRAMKRLQARDELPVDAEILRAAERIGIPPAEVVRQRIADAERERLVAAIGPKLILASDQLGEELADIMSVGGGDNRNVLAALHTIWQARWELGLYAKASEDQAPGQGEQSAGGAS